ncbi:DUF5682 family protein [Streptomyces ovatisporus]|uniref:DUF5682 family protein n=1 Tax=Streptomyces ovatisporus TaxID=1128682 RepID=A0ABV8ZZF0_9ACTN
MTAADGRTSTAAGTGVPGQGGAGPLLLGVRHHGPGSARAVRAALEARQPAVLLVEGPPEADGIVALAADEAMRPPVALLAHVLDDPGRAGFWPLAEFSPEWVAIRWALGRGVPVRFMDLPAAHSLALGEDADGGGHGHTDSDPRPGNGPDSGTDVPAEAAPDAAPHEKRGPESGEALRVDPLAVLAETAGYDDAERWWEDVVEHREGGASADGPEVPFAVLGEAMAALREPRVSGGGGSDEGGDGASGETWRDRLREAHMRLRLREACREFGAGAVAVVCGAWHVPALAAKTKVAADRQLLKGLPKVKTEITWVPWTHRRLARRSGYGAGIASPGWYGHLFSAPDRPVARWMTKVAWLLREEDYGVSSAHVIEAVRLAESLAAMRGRPLAGLGETLDAVRAVMCEGSEVPLALVQDRLVIGDVLGEVPEGAPAVPLQRDLARLQRTLRLKPEAAERELELDLRKETDAARSRLLHGLRLLGIDWGVPAASRTGSTGTFRESWRLRWEPELSVQIAEAGVWGTTVVGAATAKAVSQAAEAAALADVTALAERCLLAELPDALPVVMRVLADRAALDADVGHLAQALPALVRSVRYGDVRGTDSAALAEVAEGLAERVCVGLPPACAGLDADGASQMRSHIDGVHQSMALLGQARGESATGVHSRWRAVLHRLAVRDRIPGLIRGRCARLLLDDGRLTEEEAARLMGLVLSPGTAPAEAAAWIEGFLAGGGMLLVHDERLLALVDRWLSQVPGEAFTDVLPLLRRTFADYEPGVRRTVGELVRRNTLPDAAGPGTGTGEESGPGAAAASPGFGPGLDAARADAVLPTLRLLLPDALSRQGTGGTGAPGTDDAPADREPHIDREEAAV